MGLKVGARKKVRNDNKIDPPPVKKPVRKKGLETRARKIDKSDKKTEPPPVKKPVRKRTIIKDSEENKKKNDAHDRDQVGGKNIEADEENKKKPIKKRKTMNEDEDKKKNDGDERQQADGKNINADEENKKKPDKKRKTMKEDEDKKNEGDERQQAEYIFFHLVNLVQQQFCIFLQDIGHPRADEVNTYPVDCPAFKWQNNYRNIDCGVFMVNHMQNFKGDLYNCVELE